MNEQNQEQTQFSEVTDLPVEPNGADEIKGGPKKIFIGGLSVEETQTALPDLEPRGEIKGGPGDIHGNTYYVGTANGGVWKTTDGGTSW